PVTSAPGLSGACRTLTPICANCLLCVVQDIVTDEAPAFVLPPPFTLCRMFHCSACDVSAASVVLCVTSTSSTASPVRLGTVTDAVVLVPLAVTAAPSGAP